MLPKWPTHKNFTNGPFSLDCNKFRHKMQEYIVATTGWGMTLISKRGCAVSEWIGHLNLVVMNTGTKPTFIRWTSTTILYLILATENASTNLTNWKVMDKETRSCHRYITFESNTVTPTQVLIRIAFTQNGHQKNLEIILEWATGTNYWLLCWQSLLGVMTEACNFSTPKWRNRQDRWSKTHLNLEPIQTQFFSNRENRYDSIIQELEK